MRQNGKMLIGQTFRQKGQYKIGLSCVNLSPPYVLLNAMRIDDDDGIHQRTSFSFYGSKLLHVVLYQPVLIPTCLELRFFLFFLFPKSPISTHKKGLQCRSSNHFAQSFFSIEMQLFRQWLPDLSFQLLLVSSTPNFACLNSLSKTFYCVYLFFYFAMFLHFIGMQSVLLINQIFFFTKTSQSK